MRVTLSGLFAVVTALLVTTTSAFAQDTLSVQSKSGDPGLNGSVVRITLTNTDAVGAMEFLVVDNSNRLTPTGARLGADLAGSGFQINSQVFDPDTIKVVLFSTSGDTLPAGEKVVVEVLYDVSGLATVGQTANLLIRDIVLADPRAGALTVTGENGVFRFANTPVSTLSIASDTTTLGDNVSLAIGLNNGSLSAEDRQVSELAFTVAKQTPPGVTTPVSFSDILNYVSIKTVGRAATAGFTAQAQATANGVEVTLTHAAGAALPPGTGPIAEITFKTVGPGTENLVFADVSIDDEDSLSMPEGQHGSGFVLVNRSPVALDDSTQTAEDTAFAIDILGNDNDPDGDVLTVSLLVGSTSGTVTFDKTGDKKAHYTPPQDFSGEDTFSYILTDVHGASDTATVRVTVNAVNDAPTLTAISNPADLNEDAGEQTINLSGITTGGGESQALVVTASSGNTGLIPNPTVGYTSASATGTLKYTPAGDSSGTALITVTVRDAGLDGTANNSDDSTAVRTFTVTVNAVNDAPTLAAISDPAAIAEDDVEQTINLSGITAGGGESQALVVTASSGNTSLISNPTVGYTSASSTGTLKYTPVTDASGTALITVTVRDAGLDGTAGNSDDSTAVRTFTVTVNAVNDAPTLVTISNPTAINEDAGEQTVNLSGITAGDAEDQALVVTASSDNTGLIPNPTVVYTSASSTGTLKYTPVADVSGTALIAVTVSDAGLDGVANNSDDRKVARTFTVTVNAVNDAPTLAAISDPAAINEDASEQTINLSGITAGGGESQTLTVTASSGNTGLIPNPTVGYTSPSSTGTLKYTPVADTSGTALITVTVRDAGLDGVADNSDDSTAVRTFTVTVNGVNDAPTLAAISNPAVINEDAGQQTVNLSGITAGDDEDQVLVVTASSDNTDLIPNPTVGYTSASSTGTLTYTPVADANGTALITVTVRDAGLDGVADNGDDSTAVRTFTVTVNAVNDAPTLAAPKTQETEEDESIVFNSSNNNAISVDDSENNPNNGSSAPITLRTTSPQTQVSLLLTPESGDAVGGVLSVVDPSGDLVVTGDKTD